MEDQASEFALCDRVVVVGGGKRSATGMVLDHPRLPPHWAMDYYNVDSLYFHGSGGFDKKTLLSLNNLEPGRRILPKGPKTDAALARHDHWVEVRDAVARLDFLADADTIDRIAAILAEKKTP